MLRSDNLDCGGAQLTQESQMDRILAQLDFNNDRLINVDMLLHAMVQRAAGPQADGSQPTEAHPPAPSVISSFLDRIQRATNTLDRIDLNMQILQDIL